MARRESKTDAEALADKLIELVGFEEANRIIQARKPKSKRGRTSFESRDLWMITLAWALRIEWRKRLGCSPQDRRLPTRHALAQKIVGLFWDHSDEYKRWGLTSNKRYGASPEAVVTRLLGRPFWIDDDDGECLKRDFGEEYFELFQWYKAALESIETNVGFWEPIHQRRPDLHLLP